MAGRRLSRPSRTSGSGGGSSPAMPSQGGSSGIQVPHTNRDPVASLCPLPVRISLPGLNFEVEALAAVHWLQFLLTVDQPALMELAAELMPELEDYFLDQDEYFDWEELNHIVLDAIGIAAARPWWQVLKLTATAASNWDVIGPKLIQNGADPCYLSLAAWLDMLVIVILENMEQSKTTMFNLQLETPPPDLEDVAPAIDTMTTDKDAFLAMASM